MAHDVQLIDISYHQGSLNVPVAMRRAHGAFMRVAYGKNLDARFLLFKSLAEYYKWCWTGYTFFLADVDPEDQIRTFMNNAGHYEGSEWVYDGHFGIWTDWEKFTRPWNMSLSTFVRKGKEYLTKFETMTGIKPGMYTNLWIDSNWDKSEDWFLETYDLWAANWGVNPNYPTKGRPWRNASIPHKMHQYSGSGNGQGAYYGVGSKDCDEDTFNGTIAQFNATYDTDLQPLGGGIVIPDAVEVTVDKLNLRNSMIVSNLTLVGTTYKGKEWRPDGYGIDVNGRIWYYTGEKGPVYYASWLTKPVVV